MRREGVGGSGGRLAGELLPNAPPSQAGVNLSGHIQDPIDST